VFQSRRVLLSKDNSLDAIRLELDKGHHKVRDGSYEDRHSVNNTLNDVEVEARMVVFRGSASIFLGREQSELVRESADHDIDLTQVI